jgi:hypothetical protein
MFWNLDPIWLAMAIAMVAIVSFMLGMALDALMDDDGFGPVGNMLVMTAGFFGTIIGANQHGIIFRDLAQATATGMVGAFACLTLVALVKAALSRL